MIYKVFVSKMFIGRKHTVSVFITVQLFSETLTFFILRNFIGGTACRVSYASALIYELKSYVALLKLHSTIQQRKFLLYTKQYFLMFLISSQLPTSYIYYLAYGCVCRLPHYRYQIARRSICRMKEQAPM